MSCTEVHRISCCSIILNSMHYLYPFGFQTIQLRHNYFGLKEQSKCILHLRSMFQNSIKFASNLKAIFITNTIDKNGDRSSIKIAEVQYLR